MIFVHMYHCCCNCRDAADDVEIDRSVQEMLAGFRSLASRAFKVRTLQYYEYLVSRSSTLIQPTATRWSIQMPTQIKANKSVVPRRCTKKQAENQNGVYPMCTMYPMYLCCCACRTWHC
jgi:hypothetical protein